MLEGAGGSLLGLLFGSLVRVPTASLTKTLIPQTGRSGPETEQQTSLLALRVAQNHVLELAVKAAGTQRQPEVGERLHPGADCLVWGSAPGLLQPLAQRLAPRGVLPPRRQRRGDEGGYLAQGTTGALSPQVVIVQGRKARHGRSSVVIARPAHPDPPRRRPGQGVPLAPGRSRHAPGNLDDRVIVHQ